MHSSSTILDQTSCVSSPSAGRFGPCCCEGYIHVSIPDGLVVVWVPGLGIVPDTPLAQSQEGVTSLQVAPVSLPTQCERSTASGGQALVPELQERLTANASPAPTGSAMMLALPPGMSAAVAQLGLIKDIMWICDGRCEQNHVTGRWMVPATHEFLELVKTFDWPLMLHDEALTNHDKDIISIMPTYFMDEADANHFDRPRLDFVVSFDDGTSVRYHPKAPALVGDIDDAIGKRRRRLAMLRHIYCRDWA